MKEQLTVGSMFAGIGGICLAFRQNGCKIVWANEIDKYACKTYRLNFGDEYLVEGDIQKLDTKNIVNFYQMPNWYCQYQLECRKFI